MLGTTNRGFCSADRRARRRAAVSAGATHGSSATHRHTAHRSSGARRLRHAVHRPTSVTSAPPWARRSASTASRPCGSSDADLARELDGVAATGSHWLRVDFPWSALESAGRGRYSWAPADRLVAAANARGIHLLAMAAYTPAWDRPGRHHRPLPADRPDRVRRSSSRAAAQRYAPLGLHAWEIWNEPNMRDFWAAAARRRALHAAAASSARPRSTRSTRRRSSSARAWRRRPTSPATSIAPNEFIAGIYANGGGPYVQAVGIHPYSFPYAPMYPASWNTFYMTSQTHAIMAAHGDGAKPIWGTEIGWGTGTGSKAVSEAQQASMAAAGDHRLGPASRSPETCSGTTGRTSARTAANVFDNMGVLRYDGSAKPVARRLHDAAAQPVVAQSAGGIGRTVRGSSAPTRGSSRPAGARCRPAAGSPLNRPITGSARTPSGARRLDGRRRRRHLQLRRRARSTARPARCI